MGMTIRIEGREERGEKRGETEDKERTGWRRSERPRRVGPLWLWVNPIGGISELAN